MNEDIRKLLGDRSTAYTLMKPKEDFEELLAKLDQQRGEPPSRPMNKD